MDVTCAGCGNVFEAKTSRAKWCSDVCRKRGQRSPATSTRSRATRPSPARRRAEAAGKEVLAATRAELKKLGKTNSLEGRQAVLLATRIADPAETGANVARLVDQLVRLMEKLREATPQADAVDQAKGSAAHALRLMRGGAS